ncbi:MULTISPECIES: HlyD family secretion protein [unclassified Synechococcus]|uniref:HlyD family secretion protein n=1 Tax=unclassified Synechococcus TaxID=2626047 RepID=UPI0000698434|nr:MULTISPECIES: HlyD family efflux transporter periplasmic adaptor subunit [unclassified Synechococcus]EAQ75818.1 possible transporter component [Synechococcus sp. WH 5701]WFN59530.1 HlyD family efflux transporter periplasmic adaptor subunit [Synechococcus sp. CCFWC 502]
MSNRNPGQLLERMVSAGQHDETVLRQSRLWMRATAWVLMGTTAFAVGWLALAKTEEIVSVTGKLEPIGSVRDIQMPVGGIAASLLVKEGDQVKAGQVVMRLDTQSNRQKKRSIEQNIAATQRQLNLKDLELRKFLEMNQDQALVLDKNLSLQKDILKRYQSLAREGASAELQYLQQFDRVQQTEGQLTQTQLDRFRQQAILDQATQQLQGQLASLRSELADVEVSLAYQELRAPVSGVVFDLKPKAAGYVAQGTESVMKVVPLNKLEAGVEIPSSQIGFVHVGMPVDLSIDSFPANDFGVLEGTVRQIGSDALAPDRTAQREDYRFPARITLLSQRLKLKTGSYLPLQVGMSLRANIKLRKATYLQLLLGSFRDKAEGLRRR